LAANFYNFETLFAVLSAARDQKCDIILQASGSTLDYLGIKTAAAMARAAILEYEVTAWLHFDHGQSLDQIRACLDAGFDSVMIDASEKPFKENVALTARVVEMAASYGTHVEAELGYIAKLGQAQSMVATDAQQAADFVDLTGVDALAVAIGNAHGFYKQEPRLQFDALAEIARKVQVPLVLHGSSGIPGPDLQKAISLGICKINLATEIKNIFMRQLKTELNKTSEIDLRQVFPPATGAAINLISEKLKLINE